MASTQLTLIPLKVKRMVYKTAMENLWITFESKNGSVVNRKLALVNVRYDSESVNYVIYTKATKAVVDDVVEFE